MNDFNELIKKYGDRFTETDYLRMYEYINNLQGTYIDNIYEVVPVLSRSFILDVDTAKTIVDCYVKSRR